MRSKTTGRETDTNLSQNNRNFMGKASQMPRVIANARVKQVKCQGTGYEDTTTQARPEKNKILKTKRQQQ